MPASQGECVNGAERGELSIDRVVSGKVGDVLSIGSELTFASSCAIFRCSSLRPARTAASSELTSALG